MSFDDIESLNLFETNIYICNLCKNFQTNKRTELKKSPKIYFIDSGLRNQAISNFKSDKSVLFENFVSTELIKKNIEVKYWRTTSGAEVDFIIEHDDKIIPIEVKLNLNKTVLGKSYFTFLNKYHVTNGLVLSQDYVNKRIVDNAQIDFIELFNISQVFELLLI